MTALVLSGSIGSTTEMWEPQREAFAAFELVAADHPGHGRAPVPAGPVVLADLGAAVLERLDARGIERAHVLGLSLGGAVAMWLGANAPERVDRLVLACTRARFGDPQGWDDRAEAVRAYGMGAIVDTVIERWFTPAFRERERWRAMMASIDPEGYARCCEVLRDTDLRGDLARIEAPTLVVAGADDLAVPRGEIEELAERIPDARLVTVPGAHLPNIERPGPFAEAVVSFLG
jgi:3-oxoadipate enol-lactonase